MPHELKEAGGRPAKSGKRYKSLPRARAVVSYLNRFGVQSGRYEWRIAEHDDGTFEVWTFPRTVPKPGW
jgi:hypothetical protein